MTPESLADDRAVRLCAIDPARSFIVQAPAGSGKTSLLTLRFLGLLGVVDRPEEIVAVTFTRKAAAEMQHRIVTALTAASEGPCPDSAPEFKRLERQLAIAALARSRARNWGLEENPARLHIQTIDGMNHWLARRLPLAARIGFSVSLLDDARPLHHEAAARFVARLEEDGEVAGHIETLARLVNHQPTQLATQVEAMLAARELWLPKLIEGGATGDLRAELDRLLQATVLEELQTIHTAVDQAETGDLLAVIREAAALGPECGPLAPLAQMHEWPRPKLEHRADWQALATLLLTQQGTLRKKFETNAGFLAQSAGKHWGPLKQRMVDAVNGLRETPGVAEALNGILQLPPQQLDEAQWSRIAALCQVLPQAAAELDLLFAERGQVDHAAVAAAARTALGSQESPTELALALDYRIRHLLVDEYQDTSPAQVALLRSLLRGWEPGDGRSLFCVGDPMQSIYAFREADVTLFLEAQLQGVGSVVLEAVQLGANFRSCAAIVDWVNGAFSALMPAANDFERGAVRYSPAVAVHQDAQGDGVHIHPLFNTEAEDMGREVARLARELSQQTEGVETVAILVRGRNSLPPILEALRTAGVAYRGLELESLADRPAMRDLTALLKALLHPGDRSAWLALLRAPWCGLTLADLHLLATADVQAVLWDQLQDEAVLQLLSADGALRCRQLGRALATLQAERGARSMGSWLKTAWLALAGPATLDEPSDLANAELLFASIDTLESEVGSTPEASAIDSAVAGIMASPQGGAEARVSLMTIHKAKGLQFDAVILPDLQRAPRASQRELMYWTTVAAGPGHRGIILAGRSDKDSAAAEQDGLERWMKHLKREREKLELGRVAYVASTRARKQLHLLGKLASKDKDGQAFLSKPRAGSLLGFFWPLLQPQFESAWPSAPATTAPPAGSSRPRQLPQPLRRLSLAARLPAQPVDARAPVLTISEGRADNLRPDFDWAGIVAAAAGQVVHAELHRLVCAGLPASGIPMREHEWSRELRALGVSALHLPAAVQRVSSALAQVAGSEMAGHLLDPRHAESASELALTAWHGGEVVSLRIDRSFVDDTGTRWIVDWKTSTHEGGDRDGFLANELERYRGQLQRYAAVMATLDGRPQRLGLYFPLLDAWRELPPAG